MKISKRILIPCVSALLAVVIIAAAVAFSGSETAPVGKPVSTLPQIATQTAENETTAPVTDNTVKLSFVGDCILGIDPVEYSEGSFIWYSENYPLSYFFEKVYGVLSQDDFTIANMECVLSDNLSLKAIDKGYTPAYWFRAKAKNAGILTQGSVEFASVVNNHTDDYGDEGYSDTVKSLQDAGLMVGEDYQPVYFEKNGIKIGLVCCNLWGYWQVSYIEDALSEMQDKCDYKIVFFHGGEEGKHEPDNYKIDACRDLANSGLCDLIVGAHPHVLQPLEVVNNVPIMYSIGNFCFAGNNYPENKTVIFQANLTRNENGEIKTETNVVPCYVYTGAFNNWQPAVITDEADKSEIMDMISKPVEYQTPTEPTTTAPETSVAATEEYTEEYYYDETTEEYIPEETEDYYEEYTEEIYTEYTEEEPEYYPYPEETEIPTAIGYY